MRFKYLNELIPISILINISSAVYYQSRNQFLYNNIYPKQSLLSSTNWIPTDNNYNQHQQPQENKNSYLPIKSEYTQNKDTTSDNNKVYENYFSDITTSHGQSSSQKPIIINENGDFHQNQKLLLKTSSPIQPYGQQQAMIYSGENFYPFYSKNKNEQQQQQPEGSSSFQILSPSTTLLSEPQQQQHNSHNYMRTDSLVGQMPTKSILSLSKLSSEQNNGYGFGINGYKDETSEQYSQNINYFQQQPQQQQQQLQNFMPHQYTAANYQQLNDREKYDNNSRTNVEYPNENNYNSYQHQQLVQPHTNLNINSEPMNLKNLMQEYSIYMENQLQNQKKIEDSNNNDDEKPSASKYYQYLNKIVQSNERNKISHTPYTTSININEDMPSGSNLIDSQQQLQYINNIDVPSKTVYYQPHDIILTTSKPPLLSAPSLNPTDNIQYQKINYYHHHQPIGHHNTGRFLHNYYTDVNQINSIGQLSDSRNGHQLSSIAAISSLNSGNAIPIKKHVQVTKHIPIPIYKQIHIPIKHPVKFNVSQPVIMAVPKPYPIQIPITKPIVVPMVKEVKLSLEKIVPYPVEKKIPYTVEKRIPYPVEKYVRVPIVKPYPVKVPIFKTILHKSKVNNNYFGEWPF